MLICGIDEAGRGPVLGPMVFAGITISEEKIEALKKLGVKDSKKLLAKKREELFEQIKDLVEDYCIVSLTPQRIDEAVMGSGTSLNSLGSETTVRILQLLKPNTAILDCPSTNIKAYHQAMVERVPNTQFIVEHKADENHVVVGAASILAKVTRDRQIAMLAKKINRKIGSGYCHDEVTQKFLEKNWDKYDFFRKSWDTYKIVAEKKKQQSLTNF